MQGRIVKGIGGFYYVKASDRCVYECKARGIFRKLGITPMIGDFVEIDVKNGKGNINAIEKRKTSLVRPAAANVDILVLVAASREPDPNFLLLDKMLVHAEMNSITPVICINKTDIDGGEQIYEAYKDTGYDIVRVSALKEEGTKELARIIRGRTAAFAGLSGVGKSSLLSCMTGNELQTGAVSDKIHRGRHTTRHVELMELAGGGYVMDTPGFSSMELTGVKADELWHYFPEMAGRADGCRFRGCVHINEPDCAVKAAAEAGEISASRYQSYRELYDILKDIKEWKN